MSTEAQIILNWTTVGLYIVSTVFFAYSVSFQRPRVLNSALWLALIGLITHAIAIAIRWQLSGHGPYMAKYEVLSSNAWVTVLLFLIIAWKIPRLRFIGVIIMPFSFLILAAGLLMNPEIKRLPPTLRSIWLIMHVTFNKLAVGAIITAFAISVLYLLKEKYQESGFYQRIPSLAVLDAYSYKFIGFGFIFWTITIAAGAIWANEAWGRYWGWDPIETWSLTTWLFYGLYLHARHFFKWQGRLAAWFMVACFIFSVLTIFIIPFVVDTLHSEYFS